jgi:hypothetical protein
MRGTRRAIASTITSTQDGHMRADEAGRGSQAYKKIVGG